MRRVGYALFMHGIQRSWWVLLFSVCSFFVYNQGIKKKTGAIYEQEYRLSQLTQEREVIADIKEDLLLRTKSHSDPAWIEMILMRKLGVVPEGYMKVHFVKDEAE